MSYTDLRDFESELSKIFEVEGLTLGHETAFLQVGIEKLGGGTLGKAYTGTWRYIVTMTTNHPHAPQEVEVGRGQDYESGTPQTHEQVADAIHEIFTMTLLG